MPIASLLLVDCKEVRDYKEGLESKAIPMECCLIPQPNGEVLLVVIWTILYIFEWSIFNPLFRWMMKKGLKKAKYDMNMSIKTINRLELVRILLKKA
jgi:hypothetical protein